MSLTPEERAAALVADANMSTLVANLGINGGTTSLPGGFKADGVRGAFRKCITINQLHLMSALTKQQQGTPSIELPLICFSVLYVADLMFWCVYHNAALVNEHARAHAIQPYVLAMQSIRRFGFSLGVIF